MRRQLCRNVWRMGSTAALCIALLMGARTPAVADEVDDYVRREMARAHVPGVSVAVVRNGKTVLARGYGLANVELSAPATPDTVYEILSVTKQFTAAAILLLQEENKLTLDDPIAKHLPDTPPAWKAVTLRHLLTHTSGIPDYTDASGFFENIRQDRSPEELLKPVRDLPLLFLPGARWRYSNSGYYLLGLVIEKLSGKSYAAFLQERIFQPLGMTATRVNDLRDLIPHRASGYHWVDEQARNMPAFLSGFHGATDVLQNAIYVSPAQKWAAGAVVSTVNDLARWDAALNTEMLLKQRVLAQMWTPAKLSSGEETRYGLGNEMDSDHGHRVAGHQGGGMAFNATLLRFLDDKLTVIVLANLTQAPSRPMARHIAALFLPDLSDEKNLGIADPDPATTAQLKQVLLDASEGKADPDRFAPAARDQVVPFVRRAGPGYIKPLGALKSFVLLERSGDEKKRVLRYRAVFGETPVVWTFELTLDKISSLQPTQE